MNFTQFLQQPNKPERNIYAIKYFIMSITLKDFITARDSEQSRLLLLNKIKLSQQNFNETKIFPEFQNLITIHENIINILSNRSGIYIKEYAGKSDFIQGNEMKSQNNKDIESQFRLMEWILPYLKELLEQGRYIYEFVENNINIESIGIKSDYKKDGYLIIPDNRQKVFRILRYNCTLYKILKTREVDNYSWNVIIVPREFLRNYLLANDILNQIIYLLDTELSFPYNETISPIARRKFIKFLEKDPDC